jgi:hypothetical protein
MRRKFKEDEYWIIMTIVHKTFLVKIIRLKMHSIPYKRKNINDTNEWFLNYIVKGITL